MFHRPESRVGSRQDDRYLNLFRKILDGALGTPVAVNLGYDWGAGRFWDRAEPETFLLPADFEGPILVAYDQSVAAQEYEGGARVYRVPTHGVVRTRAPFPEGVRSIDWFVVGTGGRQTYLYRRAWCDGSETPPGVQACPLRRGRFSDGIRYELWYVSRAPMSRARRRARAQAWEIAMLERLGVVPRR